MIYIVKGNTQMDGMGPFKMPLTEVFILYYFYCEVINENCQQYHWHILTCCIIVFLVLVQRNGSYT